MTSRLPRVFNVAPGGHFLAELAEAVLSGFPIGDAERPLSDWTILLPTRRAARALAETLRKRKGAKALILPRIKPIGDLDEDRLTTDMVSADLPPALSPAAQLFVLLDLVKSWLAENQQLPFAQEIAGSHLQTLALAESLDELLQRVETQECGFEKLQEAYGAEYSQHREAILGLLSLLSTRLPKILETQGKIGAAERRSRMIRLEAARIAQGGHSGPIIAAGSTGTIPATRVLLDAIARHGEGAVVLPGLDFFADEESWVALTPEHPQFALKELLDSFGLARNDVKPLSKQSGHRTILGSELMRPSAVAEKWHELLPVLRDKIEREAGGLTEIAAPDRNMEARAVALVLREALAYPERTATLVTPDRDLATRVTSELQRYDIAIEDSAGTSLANLGAGSLLDLLCTTCLESFTAESLMSVLRHADTHLDWQRSLFESTLLQLEVSCLRGLPFNLAETTFSKLVTAAREAHGTDRRAHPLVQAITPQHWQLLGQLAGALDQAIGPLRNSPIDAFAAQLTLLQNCLNTLAPDLDWGRPINQAVADMLLDLEEQANGQPVAQLSEVAMLVQHFLRKTTGPPPTTSHNRLAILGTLEARLLPADVMILGGLNEQIWPAQADTGPWLNRVMREKLGLPQPEREIGLAAHDFIEGLGHETTYLTWSARLGGAPASPSRWLLRLDTVLKTAGIKPVDDRGANYVSWAKALHRPNEGLARNGPVNKPMPKPPVALRPRHFSVTEVERLVRNPYAVFARRILQLEPLPEFGFTPDAAMRGSLFHDAINLWNEQQAPDPESLIDAGRSVFAPLQDQHNIGTFWWPQFLRMANWLAEQEPELKQGLLRIHAETRGKFEFEMDGTKYALSARADRIDALENATRIIDYKTGSLPAPDQVDVGFSPQLPLEAAILRRGGFTNIRAGAAIVALYIRISASMKGLEIKSPISADGATLEELAEKHFEGFKALLTLYHNEAQAYLPRLHVFKDGDVAEFDHLSRYLEWQTAGEP